MPSPPLLELALPPSTLLLLLLPDRYMSLIRSELGGWRTTLGVLGRLGVPSGRGVGLSSMGSSMPPRWGVSSRDETRERGRDVDGVAVCEGVKVDSWVVTLDSGWECGGMDGVGLD